MQTERRSRTKIKVPTKTCTKCNAVKPATKDYFGPDARGLYGLRGDCRLCRRAADISNKKRRERREQFRPVELVELEIDEAEFLRGFKRDPEPTRFDPDSVLSDYVDASVVHARLRARVLEAKTRLEDSGPMMEVRVLPGKVMQRVLFIPDCHHPYNDKAAWQLMLQAARLFKPDIIIILGDFGDFYSVSAHSKNPNRVRNLESEVEAINAALDELDALGAKQKVFVTGNHEDRLERYLMDKAPELFNMVRVRDLFKLAERGWMYVPYKRHAKIGHLHVTHDTNRAGRYAHYQSQADFGGANVVIGHTHRLGYMVEGCAQGQPHVSAMFGWLGDFDSVDYMHQVRARRDWAHGFGIGYLEPSGVVHMSPVPIVNRTVVIEGKLVKLDWKA